MSSSPEEPSHNDEDNVGGGLPLPEDLVFEVLTRVPLNDLAACRVVCTRWRRLTYEVAFAPLHCRRAAAVSGYLFQGIVRNRYHADFVYMHRSPAPSTISLDFLPFANVRVEAVAAHGGLACCVEASWTKKARYYVCKPSTRQWRALPNPRVRFRTAAVAMVARPSGAAAEFKIVRFSSFPAVLDLMCCEVFDSRSFAWKRAPDVRLSPTSLQLGKPVAMSAHGAMHWLRCPVYGAQDVFVFDVMAERWWLVPLPTEVDEMYSPQPLKQNVAVEGRLRLLVLAGPIYEKVLEVWEMANYEEQMWKKKMTVSLKGLPIAVASLHGFFTVTRYDFWRGKMEEFGVEPFCIQEIFKYESDMIPCNIGRRACRSSS